MSRTSCQKLATRLTLVAVIMMHVSPALAVDVEWNGSADNDYNNSGNWQDGFVPGVLDQARIGTDDGGVGIPGQTNQTVNLNDGSASFLNNLEHNRDTNASNNLFNITGAGTSLNIQSTTRMGQEQTGAGTLTIDGALFNTGINNGGNFDIARGGGTNGNAQTINLNNGAIMMVYNDVIVGQDNQDRGRAIFNIDATSQLRIEDNFRMRGGDNDSQGVYSFGLSALSDSPITGKGGTINLERGLFIANSNDTDVAVTLNSSSAAVSNFRGELDIATNDRSTGVLTLNDGQLLNFRQGTSSWGTGGGTPDATATVNLNNGSQIRVRTLEIGQANQDRGTASINLDATSRLMIRDDFNIRGGDNDGQATYNLKLAGRTPTDGMVSVGRALRIAVANDANIDLTVDNTSAANQFYGGQLDIATNDRSQGSLTVGGTQRLNFGRNDSNWATGNGLPDAVATVTLNDSAQIRLGNSLNIGRDGDDRSRANITLNGTSRLHVDSELRIRGGFSDGQAAYNLPLAGRSPADGMVSIGSNLAIAQGTAADIALTVDNTSAADQFYAGALHIARSDRSTGSLTINDGVRMNFARDTSQWATGNGLPDAIANVTLNGGSQLRLGASLEIGRNNDDRSRANITLNGTSRLHVDDQFEIRGGFNDGTATYNLPLAGSTPTDGMVSVGRALAIATRNDADISLTVDNTSAADQFYTGQLRIATNDRSHGALTINDGRRMNFARDTSQWATGAGNPPDDATATVTLNGGSRLRLGATLEIGRDGDDRGSATIAINGTSRMHVDDDLEIRGGDGDGTATYSLPLAGLAPVDGGLSVGRALRVATRNNADIDLTVTGGPTQQFYAGRLNLATASGSDGVMTVEGGQQMNFARDTSDIATGGNNAAATLTLNGGSVMRFGQTLRIGQNGDDRGFLTLALNGGSRLSVDDEFDLRGGNSDGTGTYNFGISSTLDPQAGTVSLGQGLLRIASRNQADIDVTFNSTSAANVDLRNELQLAVDGSNNDGKLTLDTSMNFGGRGRFAQNNNNHAFVQLNNEELGFNGGQTEIRNNNNASAEIVGTGLFDGGDNLRSNGALLADGGNLNVDYGNIVDNNLAVAQAGNTNPLLGQAGWYADNDGTLVLRELRNRSGDTSLGEAVSDASLDLVNSARVHDWQGAATAGPLGLGVIDPNHSSVSGLTNQVGVYELTGAAAAATSNDVTFRYDDVAAGANAGSMSVFQLQGGNWVDVTNGGADTGTTVTAENVDLSLGRTFAVATAGAAGGAHSVTAFVGNRAGIETVSGGNENWNADGTWNNDQPEGRDTVRIRGGHAVTLNSGNREKAQDLRLSDGNNQTGNSLTIEAGSHLRIWDSLEIARATNTDATLTLNDTSTLQIDDNLNIGGAANGGGIDGLAGTINVNGTSALTVFGNLTIGNADADDASAINIASTARMHIGGDLNLQGEDAVAGTTPSYTLPIAGWRGGAGFLAVEESIRLQNGNNGAVVLNVDSTLAPGLAAATRAEFDGELRVGQNDNSSATLNLTSVDWFFDNQVTVGNSNGDVNHGASTLNLVNSKVITRDDLRIGRNDNQQMQTITLDATSQIQAHSLQLMGETGFAHAYTLPITGSEAKDGFISIREDLNVSGGSNESEVTLNLNSTLPVGQAADSLIQIDGNLRVAGSNDRTTGTLNLTDVRIEAARGLDIGDQDGNALRGDGNLNLVNSQVIVRDNLTIGRNDNEQQSTITLDATSQIQAHSLQLRGQTGFGHVYTLPLTGSTAKDGFISIREDIAVGGNNNNSEVTLNLDSTTGDAAAADTRIEIDGTLRVAGQNDNTTGTLNMTSVRMEVARGIEIGDQNGDATRGDGNLNLVDSHVIARDDLTIGRQDNEQQSSITLDATSSMQANSLQLRGQDGFGHNYTLPLTGAFEKDGFISIRENIHVGASNESKVTLNLDSTLAAGLAADTRIELDGSVRVAGSNDRTSGTLNLTSVHIEAGGGLEIGDQDGNAARGDGNLNLVNSQVIVRDDLNIGRQDNEQQSTISLDATSRIQANSLNLRGEKGFGLAYTLPLTGGVQEDGKISIRENLNVSNQNNSSVELTLDATLPAGLAAAPIVAVDGSLNVATNNDSEAVLNLNGVTINTGTGANVATASNSDVVINMASGGITSRDDMNLRNNASASLTIQGDGTIATGSRLRMNARLIADGGTIDVGYENLVLGPGNDGGIDQNQTSLMGDGNRAGWYAQNQGRINLPTLQGVQGNVAWGDNRDDTSPDVNDLVNSVVLDFTNLAGPINLDGSLLASDNSVVPIANALTNPIGFWEFAASDPLALVGGSVTFETRYDDALAVMLGVNESDLDFLFHSGEIGTGWIDVSLLTNPDTVNKLFLSDSVSSFGFFAIAEDFDPSVLLPGPTVIPEPGTFLLALTALLALLAFGGRRRRNRS